MPTPLIATKLQYGIREQELQADIQCLRKQLAEAQSTIEDQARIVEFAKELLLSVPLRLSKLDDAIMELHGGGWRHCK